MLALRAAKNETHQLSAEVRRNDVDAVKQTLREIQDRSDTARGHSDNCPVGRARQGPRRRRRHRGRPGDGARARRRRSHGASRAREHPARPGSRVTSCATPTGGSTCLRSPRSTRPSRRCPLPWTERRSRSTSSTPTSSSVPWATSPATCRTSSTTLAATARGGATVTRLVPPMLGQDGPRQYLLVVQNNAEIRSTGGLPGSLQILRADNGKLTLAEQRSVDDFDVLDAAGPPADRGGAGAVRRQPRREHPGHQPDPRLPAGRRADERPAHPLASAATSTVSSPSTRSCWPRC